MILISHSKLVLLFVLAFLLVHCSSSTSNKSRGTMFHSNSSESAPRRASKDRPGAPRDEKGPFEADRMLIDGYEYRTAAAHGESHGEQALELNGFSHPACSGIPKEEKVRCPLSDIKWANVKKIPGGVSMEAKSAPANPGHYRRRLLCHIAFGISQGKRTSCPLHLYGVQVRLIVRGSRTVLMMTSANSSAESAMNKLVRRLFQ